MPQRNTKASLEKNGLPYISHPIAVAEIALDMEVGSGPSRLDQVYAVALFHDLKEDTQTTDEELYAVLKKANFSDTGAKRIVKAVTLLTKAAQNFDIIKYLHAIRAASCDIALVVKLADLHHNMSDLRPGNLLDKYKLCVHFLTDDPFGEI